MRRCEEKYGYKEGEHQRVIVEHIKDGRQHFHVIWNRVSLTTGKAVWPGHHWNKSKQAAREMERELGLKHPIPKRVKKLWAALATSGRSFRYFGRYRTLNLKPSIDGVSLSQLVTLAKSEKHKAPIPTKPSGNLSGMCEAQRVDFIAACEGKITWRTYFEKWSDRRPSL